MNSQQTTRKSTATHWTTWAAAIPLPQVDAGIDGVMWLLWLELDRLKKTDTGAGAGAARDEYTELTLEGDRTHWKSSAPSAATIAVDSSMEPQRFG